MEMNFKDFLNFFKLPPHIFSALAIGSGLILFVPDKIAQKLYLLKFRNDFGWIISIIFIISITLLITIMIIKLCKYLKERYDMKKLRKAQINYLKELNPTKTKMIKAFLKEEDNTISVNYLNGVTQQLLSLKIISFAGNTVPTGIYDDDLMPIVCFLQPWVIKMINEDQELKNKFYGKIKK